jgi:hypothetical protein
MRPTKEDLKERLGEPVTWSVPEAGYLVYEAGRNRSYDLAKEGVIPTIRVGNRLRVSRAWVRRMAE